VSKSNDWIQQSGRSRKTLLTLQPGAAAFVLQRAQTLAGSTGRTFSAGPPRTTCTDVSVPAGAGRRHLLQTTRAMLATSVTSVGPKPAGDTTGAADELARLVQSTVDTTLVEVLETAATSPGFAMDTQLAQVGLDGHARPAGRSHCCRRRLPQWWSAVSCHGPAHCLPATALHWCRGFVPSGIVG
jgi:hypothetical protein